MSRIHIPNKNAHIKFLLVSIVMALLDTGTLLMKIPYGLWIVEVLIILPVIQIRICFGANRRTRMFRIYMEELALLILINGIGEGLGHIICKRVYFGIWYGLAWMMVYLIEESLRYSMHQRAYASRITLVNNELSVEVVALADSGNCLMDENCDPVSFLKREYIEKLQLPQVGNVEFQAVGDLKGSSPVYELEQAIIGDQIVKRMKIADGGAVVTKGRYEMILNQAYLECRRENQNNAKLDSTVIQKNTKTTV